jgi:hypothetical protein
MVGKTYPPDFYSWIKNNSTRRKFEKLAEETEEDYQCLVNLLENKFNVKTVRPEFPKDTDCLFVDGKWVQPPTAPRDYFLMIHDRFWVPKVPNASHAWNVYYRKHKKEEWPDGIARPEDLNINDRSFWQGFDDFRIKDQTHLDYKLKFYDHIFNDILKQGNKIVYTKHDFINGCFVSRLGKNLIFATQTYHDNKNDLSNKVNQLFPGTQNKIVDAQGHGDAVYCPVTPGLIISLNDISTYKDTFPDWEVVYLPDSDYAHMRKFEQSMKINKGRWFMPGFEKDQNLIHLVDYYFDEWVGEVHETVFDVNILVVDPKNIIVSSHNDRVEQACARYGIDVHVSPFRHKYFWDCGIHCITNDLSRKTTNIFPVIKHY